MMKQLLAQTQDMKQIQAMHDAEVHREDAYVRVRGLLLLQNV